MPLLSISALILQLDCRVQREAELCATDVKRILRRRVRLRHGRDPRPLRMLSMGGESSRDLYSLTSAIAL